MERLQGKEEAPMLDMTFFSSYDNTIGFRYNLEALVKMGKENSLFQAVTSIVPPGSPYLADGASLFAAYPYSQLDWDSSTDHFMFLEDDIVTNNVALTRSSSLIIDIFEFDLKTKKFTRIGFCLYPLVRVF
jgi:hypothetical protein